MFYIQDGIMATHDEETRRFFKHSSVQVLLCPRTGGKRHSWVKQKVKCDNYFTLTHLFFVVHNLNYGMQKGLQQLL